MTSIRPTLAIAITLALGFAGTALAGAPGSDNRLGVLDAFCQGGVSHGSICGAPDDCPNGRCQIQRDGARKRPFQVLATLIIDDDVGEWNDSEVETGNHAVAVLLEFIAGGRRRVVSQVYQSNDPRIPPAIADLANSDRNLDEALAAGAILDRGIFDDFLFQRPDGAMEKEIQRYYDTTGSVVVLRTRSVRIFSDHTDDTLATTIQVRLEVGITPAAE